ncbi:MAG: LysR family transcriptional regulator [Deltaproteobacteria bacterium]|nr:LysR family transcriptional regulator [Deltaproteobacteria bacterium]
MIEMRQIQVFLAVSELLNFSRAAEKIHLTQPTVSSHLKALERYLGAELLERGGREIRLTPAGELFLPYARRIYSLQERARQELSLYTGAASGTLEIGGSNTPGQYILPGVIGSFSRERQKVRITLRIGDSESIISQIGDGRLELGLVGTPAPAGDFISHECLGDELILVAGPATATGLPDKLTTAVLRKIPLIIREKGSATRRVTLSALRDIDIRGTGELNIVAEMGSVEAIRQALKNDLGAAIISDLAVGEDLANGALVRLELPGEPIRRNFYLVCDRNRKLSPLAEALSRFIIASRS